MATGIDVVTVSGLGMAGTPDLDVFTYAVTEKRTALTENVADFVAIAAQHSTTGDHHHGLLIALSNRFLRRSWATPGSPLRSTPTRTTVSLIGSSTSTLSRTELPARRKRNSCPVLESGRLRRRLSG